MAATITQIIGAVTISTQEILASKYTKSFLVLITFVFAATIVYLIFKKVLRKLSQKTRTDLDDIILKKAEVPVSLLILFSGIKSALSPLQLEEGISLIAHDTLSSILIMIATYLSVAVIDALIEKALKNFAHKTHSKVDDQLLLLSRKTVRFLATLLAMIFILQVWGVKIGPLLASLGIVGIAVAFGLQNTLGNVFGGISMIIDRSIRVGDLIKLDEDTAGEIVDIGLRATKIRTYNNELVIIPNGLLANQKIKNYVLPDTRARIEVPFSVAYGTDIKKVKSIILGEIKKLEFLDQGRLKSGDTRVMFVEMGPSSLNFKAQVWLTDYEQRFQSKEKLNTDIYNALYRNKIAIPFPQMDVHMDVHKKVKKYL